MVLPKVIVCFRHCDKLQPCPRGSPDGYPKCCNPADIPPLSCNDCSPLGYQRAAGLPRSLDNLMSQIAPGNKITGLYAAASRDILAKCPRSRRTWELVVPLSGVTSLGINTKYCSSEQEDAARDILANNPNGYVTASWEHTAIPGLVGWLIALAMDPHATAPHTQGIPKWHGDVFDQYWIVDLRGTTPRFFIEPEKILPGDCPYARDPDGECPPGLGTGAPQIIGHGIEFRHILIILLIVLLLVWLLK